VGVSPAKILQTLLSNPVDVEHVRSLTTPDVIYVSLNEHNPDLKALLPWTGTNKGPESIAKIFTGINETWETKAFEVRDVIEQSQKNTLPLGRKTGQNNSKGGEDTQLPNRTLISGHGPGAASHLSPGVIPAFKDADS
jgi:hypothetical protein